MLYPRLASLVVMFLSGALAYLSLEISFSMLSRNNSPEELAGVIGVISLLAFGFLAVSGFFGFIMSFAVEPVDGQGAFRWRETMLANILRAPESVGGKFIEKIEQRLWKKNASDNLVASVASTMAGYCETSAWMTLTWIFFLFFLFTFCLLAFLSVTKTGEFLRIMFVLGTIFGVIALMVLIGKYILSTIARRTWVGGVGSLCLIAGLGVFMYANRNPSPPPINWLVAAQMVGFIGLCFAGVFCAIYLHGIVTKLKIYSAICPRRLD